MRIGKAVGRRIAIHEPQEPSLFADHQIGILVELEKRRDFLHPVSNLPIEENPRIGRNIVREDDFQTSEVGGEKELARKRQAGDTTAAGIGGHDVLFARRIIEFLGFSSDEDVIIGNLPEINFGTGDLQIDRRDRRDIANKKLRQTFCRDPVHRAEGDPIAVRVGEMLVDPDPAR